MKNITPIEFSIIYFNILEGKEPDVEKIWHQREMTSGELSTAIEVYQKTIEIMNDSYPKLDNKEISFEDYIRYAIDKVDFDFRHFKAKQLKGYNSFSWGMSEPNKPNAMYCSTH